MQLCSDANKTATSSSHQDSEYDTASDSQSSDEAALLPKHEPVFPSHHSDGGGQNVDDELIDADAEDADDDIDDEEGPLDDGSSLSSSSLSSLASLERERQRGDGEEEHDEESKKVDDDEDRSNPQYIPKRGIFYEHDDRTADDVYVELLHFNLVAWAFDDR